MTSARASQARNVRMPGSSGWVMTAICAVDAQGQRLWRDQCGSTPEQIEVAVRRLRAKLDDPFPAKLLHTVRGMGYVLEERS